MPLPNYVLPTDIFFTWLDATNNLTSHVSNTSAYILVAQNATPAVTTGNVAIDGTLSLTTLSGIGDNDVLTINVAETKFDSAYHTISTGTIRLGLTESYVQEEAALHIAANWHPSKPHMPFIISSTTDDMVLRVNADGGNLYLGDWDNWIGTGHGDGGGEIIIRAPLYVHGPLIFRSHDNLGVGSAVGTLNAFNGEYAFSDLYNTDLTNTRLLGNTVFFREGTANPTSINSTHVSTTTLVGDGSQITGLNATSLTTGIVSSVLLPVANTTANGIVTTTTQSFAGVKTFTSNVTVSGALTATASNATNLNSQPASFYTNASNLSTGTVPLARLTVANTTANGVVSTGAQSIAGEKTFTNAVTVQDSLVVGGTIRANTIYDYSVRIVANGEFSGTPPDLVLETTGGNLYVNSSGNLNLRAADSGTATLVGGSTEVFAPLNSVTLRGWNSIDFQIGNEETGVAVGAFYPEEFQTVVPLYVANTARIGGNVDFSGDRLLITPTDNQTGDWRLSSQNGIPMYLESFDQPITIEVTDTQSDPPTFNSVVFYPDATTIGNLLSVTITTLDVTATNAVIVGNTRVNIEATQPGVVLDATGIALYQANVVLGRGDTYVLFPNFAADGSKLWFQDGEIQFANTTLIATGEAGGLITPLVLAQDLTVVPQLRTQMETTGLLIETIADEDGNQDYRVLVNNSVLQMESLSGSVVTTLTSGGLTTANVNATRVSGNGSALTSVNAVALGGKTEGQLNVNSAASSNNSTFLNGQPASFYTNASNLSTGTVPLARLDSSVLLTTSTTGINASALSTGTVPLARLTSANTTAAGVVDTTTQSFAGVKTFTSNVTMSGVLAVEGVRANGSLGSSGQVLTSNGSVGYWSTLTYASPDDVIALAIALG